MSEESVALMGCVSVVPRPPRCPASSLVRNKVQYILSGPESAVVMGCVAMETLASMGPSSLSRGLQYSKPQAQKALTLRATLLWVLPPNHDSKSLSGPKVKHRIVSGSESADINEEITQKLEGALPVLGEP